MSRHSPIRRIVASAYLTLAFVLAGFLPVAEARAVLASSTAVEHVEAPDQSRSCAAVHDHWSCGVCRALRLKARGEPPILVLLGGASAIELPLDARVSPAASLATAPVQPRAPPASRAI